MEIVEEAFQAQEQIHALELCLDLVTLEIYLVNTHKLFSRRVCLVAHMENLILCNYAQS